MSLEPANTRSHEEATEDRSKGLAENCNGEGIPEWLEDFAENLQIAEVPAPANISHESDPERPKKSGVTEAQCSYSLPERPKLRGLQANQGDKGSLQKANWKFSTSSREVW